MNTAVEWNTQYDKMHKNNFYNTITLQRENSVTWHDTPWHGIKYMNSYDAKWQVMVSGVTYTNIDVSNWFVIYFNIGSFSNILLMSTWDIYMISKEYWGKSK